MWKDICALLLYTCVISTSICTINVNATYADYVNTYGEAFTSTLASGKGTFYLSSGYADSHSAKKTQCKSDPGTLKVSIYDKETKAAISGAKLSIVVKSSGKVIETWVSSDEAHTLYGLKTDEQYMLIEELAPRGYKKAECIVFNMREDTLTELDMYNEFEYKQDSGTRNEVKNMEVNHIEPNSTEAMSAEPETVGTDTETVDIGRETVGNVPWNGEYRETMIRTGKYVSDTAQDQEIINSSKATPSTSIDIIEIGKTRDKYPQTGGMDARARNMSMAAFTGIFSICGYGYYIYARGRDGEDA